MHLKEFITDASSLSQAVTVATQASLSDAEQNQNSKSWHLGRAVFCRTSGSLFLDCTEFIKKLQPVPCKVC